MKNNEKTRSTRSGSIVVVLAQTRTNTLVPLSGSSARSGKERAEARPERTRLNQLQQAQIQVMYQHGRSTRYIAAHFGIGKTTVLGVLKRRGVMLRRRGHSVMNEREAPGTLSPKLDS